MHLASDQQVRSPAFLGRQHVFRSRPPVAPSRRHSHGRPSERRRGCAVLVLAQDETVAVTGATGLVGSKLVSKLIGQRKVVRVLTRDVAAAKRVLPYPRLQFFPPGDWPRAVCGTCAVINLAGEAISTRWTPAIKDEIKRSRVGVTRRLVESMEQCPQDQRPQVFISSSAIGYYGASAEASFTEASSSGNDYLAEVCRAWEAEALRAPTRRTVVLRTGIVLAREGGALGKMLPVFSLFAGGPLGSGRQWMSWIHRDDLVQLYLEALANPAFEGVYNATAPQPVQMADLCAQLGATLGRPSWLPVPDFALTALLGEGAAVVLDGQRVLPARAQEAGFSFQYPTLEPALQNLFG